MNRKVLIFGIFATLILVGVLYTGLGKDPHKVESPLIGRAAPSFQLREVGTGRPVSLESLRGKPVVLNFWATWCVPCFEENPILVAKARQMGDSVQFLGVVFEDEEPKILQFLQQNGSAYPTVMDDKGKTAIAYGVGGVPETFFITREGRIVSKFEGPIPPDTLDAEIGKAIGRGSVAQ